MMIQPETFDARIVATRMLTPSVREVVFQRMDGKAFVYEPGQWVNLMLPLASGEAKRAYSIACGPTGSARFELAITRVAGGAGSEYLHEAPVGTSLRAMGPYGLFTRDPTDMSPALFVATGTGLAPLRSMLQAALGAGSKASLWVLLGVRFEQDILYRQEFESLTTLHPQQIRYEVTLSQPDASWSGRRGYVQVHVPALYQELAASTTSPPHVYICGLDRMVSTVKSLARNELGVGRKNVHIERYD